MNKQKGFSTILLVIILLVISVGVYYYFSPKLEDGKTIGLNEIVVPNEEVITIKDDSEIIPPQGATYVPEDQRVKVIAPVSGEKAEIGKVLLIKWNNYSGSQKLNIGLQITKPNGQIEVKNIATNVSNTGQYEWIVSSESLENSYKIEVQPYGDRARIGRSNSFSIVGEKLIQNVSPDSNSRVDASKPIEITGLAKGVYNEAEFNVEANYVLDGSTKIIDQTYATCSIDGNGCDWTSNKFLDFKTSVDLSSSPVCYVTVEFTVKNEKDNSPKSKPFYILPLWLYGINDCK